MHLVRKHKREGGRVEAYVICTTGDGGLTRPSMYAKKSRLTAFVIFGDDFH